MAFNAHDLVNASAVIAVADPSPTLTSTLLSPNAAFSDSADFAVNSSSTLEAAFNGTSDVANLTVASVLDTVSGWIPNAFSGAAASDVIIGGDARVYEADPTVRSVVLEALLPTAPASTIFVTPAPEWTTVATAGGPTWPYPGVIRAPDGSFHHSNIAVESWENTVSQFSP
jgi:hypothetical protein